MHPQMAIARSSGFGVLAFGIMLAVYFGALTLVSGWSFTLNQFSEFWYYIVPLAAGFGIQVALFVQLRQVISRSKGTGTVLAASGTTSTAAMVSCCAHYLANVAPVLGATGLVAFAALWLVALLGPILTPFVLAALLGWLGDPLVDRLERSGRSRPVAVTLVFVLMVMLVVLVVLILVPMVERQVVTLVEALPEYREWFMGTALPWVEARTGIEITNWLDLVRAESLPYYGVDEHEFFARASARSSRITPSPATSVWRWTRCFPACPRRSVANSCSRNWSGMSRRRASSAMTSWCWTRG